MIYLKNIITEEKRAFQMERDEELKYSIFSNDNLITITLLTINNENIGRITLDNSFDDLGDIKPKPGYLYIDFVETNYKGEGFGFLLYKAALKYCQKNRYKGLTSCKEHRIGRTEHIWDRIKTFEDEYYTYSDIKELSRI